ncbi:hypothetical protein [Evansella halocellulosilytica]|uniref:hypothetical protein n=1 Tax=Evansella halocellulosilytica TaxID=2011013 RepID=UPI000BB7F0DC|nr:hypothetical protein [Evansella halocellulosilytica]
MADFTNQNVRFDPFVRGDSGVHVQPTLRYDSSGDYVETRTQTDYEADILRPEIDGSNAYWNFRHVIGIPYGIAPSIGYNYRAIFNSNGSGSINGYHDKAPAHEVMIYIPESAMNFIVHTRDNEGFSNLLPAPGTTHHWSASF